MEFCRDALRAKLVLNSMAKRAHERKRQHKWEFSPYERFCKTQLMTFRPYVQGMWRQPLNIRRQNIQSGKIIMKLYCIYKYVCHYIYYITNNFKTKSECDLCIISYKLIFIIYLTYTRWWLYRYSNMNIILQDNLYIICLSHSIICYLCIW